jgi:hypothetical protein
MKAAHRRREPALLAREGRLRPCRGTRDRDAVRGAPVGGVHRSARGPPVRPGQGPAVAHPAVGGEPPSGWGVGLMGEPTPPDGAEPADVCSPRATTPARLRVARCGVDDGSDGAGGAQRECGKCAELLHNFRATQPS